MVVFALAVPCLEAKRINKSCVEKVLAAHPDEVAQCQAAAGQKKAAASQVTTTAPDVIQVTTTAPDASQVTTDDPDAFDYYFYYYHDYV